MENKNKPNDIVWTAEPMIPLEQAFRFAEWCSNNKWKYSWAKRLWFNETNPEKGRMNSELFELFNQEYNELERD